MKEAVPDLVSYIRKGSAEIGPKDFTYTSSGH